MRAVIISHVNEVSSGAVVMCKFVIDFSNARDRLLQGDFSANMRLLQVSIYYTLTIQTRDLICSKDLLFQTFDLFYN